ncbi:MAG TPA: zinc ribbon domain-containing protein [Ktedonobacterales bacterium]
MEYCVYCQAPLAPGDRVCQNCGRMQPLAEFDQATMAGSNLGTVGAAPCPRCGTLAASTDPYCRNCGLPLNSTGDQATRRSTTNSQPTPTPPPPSRWQNQPATPAYPASEQAWNQEEILTPPPPPEWVQRPPPYQPGMTDPQGNFPTMSGPPPGWQAGSNPYPAGGAPPFPGTGPRYTMPPPGISKPQAPRSRRPFIIAAIVLVALIILGGGGAAAFLLTRPTPTLSVTGPTQSGSNPAGAPDTKLHVSGANYTSRSLITFFLDGKSLQGTPTVQTDDNGSFAADLTITDDWLLGQHMLSAKDGKDNGPKNAVAVVVLAAPMLTITSQYQQGNTPAGSAGTTFTLMGKRFALSSQITLLLDGNPLAGQAPITSDDHGRVQVDITIGTDWSQAQHTFTAKDAQGNQTKSGAQVVIVPQGVAGTPGPKGAPADNESFTLIVNVSAKDSQGDDASFTQGLNITGQPDPAGGTVCGPDDDGQPHTFTGSVSSGVTYTETVVFSCKGTYKSGHLTYTETAVSDKFTLSDGDTCTVRGFYVYGQFDGTFTDASNINGTYRRAAFNAPCQRGIHFSSLFRNTAQGTWTGSK